MPELDAWLTGQVNKNLGHNRKYFIPTLEDVQTAIFHLRARSPRLGKFADTEALSVVCVELVTRLVSAERAKEQSQLLEDVHDVWWHKALKNAVTEEEAMDLEEDPAERDADLELKLRHNHTGHVHRLQEMQQVPFPISPSPTPTATSFPAEASRDVRGRRRGHHRRRAHQPSSHQPPLHPLLHQVSTKRITLPCPCLRVPISQEEDGHGPEPGDGIGQLAGPSPGRPCTAAAAADAAHAPLRPARRLPPRQAPVRSLQRARAHN